MSKDDYEEYAYEVAEAQFIEEVIEGAREEIINEFQEERLSSFYDTHKGLEKPALKFIDKAKELLEIDTTSAFVMAYAASEYVVKKVFLEPVVAGFIHDESVDEIIAPIVMKDKNFINLLFIILANYDVKVEEELFSQTKRTIKQEWQRQRKIRNDAVHRCEEASLDDAKLAILLAEKLSGEVFSRLLGVLGIRYSS